jgi:CHAT domain-containing protein/tetratricopeptide (TPR) repeat protein
MTRARDRCAAALTFLLVVAMAADARATGSAPTPSPAGDTHASESPMLCVPRPAGPDTAIVWSTLGQLERARQWAASESLATALVHRISQSARPDSLDLSRAWLYVANALAKRRQYRDGRVFQALDQAIGIRTRNVRGPDPLLIWAHVLAASAHEDADHANRSRAEGETALRLLESAGGRDTAMLAQAHLALGMVFDDLGDKDASTRHFESALAFRTALDGPDGLLVVPILASYGLMLGNQGEFDPGRERLIRALEITERHPGPNTELMEGVLGRLSTLEDRVGDTEQSLDYAERAYELSRRRLGDDAVVPLRLRAMQSYRLFKLGDLTGMVALLRTTVPALATAVGNENANAINTRLAYVDGLIATGDTTTAVAELAVACRALASQPGSRGYDNNRVYYLQLIGDLEHARGRNAAARESLEVAVKMEWDHGGHTGGRRAILYQHWYDTVTGPADRPEMGRAARDIDRLVDSTWVRSTWTWEPMLAARAAAEARAGLRDSAWAHALEAERIARQNLQMQLTVLPDRRALQLAATLGTPCDVLVALERPDHAEDLALTWDRIVRWRGLVRHEIARRRAPVGASADTALAAAHARWIQAQRRLAQLVVSGAASPDDPESATLYDSARREAETAEARYARIASGTIPAPDSVSLTRVLARVGAGQTLVAFVLGSIGPGTETLGAFVAAGTNREPRWVSLGSASDRETEVRDWVRALSTPPRDARDAAAAERRCRRLGDVVRTRIWEPIEGMAPDTREWILVPEACATEIPWPALPLARGGYLAEGGATLRILDAERDLLASPDAVRGSGLLAVGGPDFDLGGATPDTPPPPLLALRARSWPCSGSAIALPPLPAARAEAEDIAHAWPDSAGAASLLTGASADEARVKADAAGHAVIHIATHGVVVEDTCAVAAPGTRGIGAVSAVGSQTPPGPAARATVTRHVSPWLARQVWLALAGANRPPSATRDENEGLLTAEEVVTLDLRGTDWVVLSACHSGAAPAWAREGVLGMQRAFRLAGARAVIASRWGVGDESTREWMRALYAARDHGDGAAAAVQSACRTVLAARRASHRPTHPFYWAAFGASGE